MKTHAFISGLFKSSGICYVPDYLCLVAISLCLDCTCVILFDAFGDSYVSITDLAQSWTLAGYPRTTKRWSRLLPGINISDADMSDGTRWMTLLVAASIGRLYVDPSFCCHPWGPSSRYKAGKLKLWGIGSIVVIWVVCGLEEVVTAYIYIYSCLGGYSELLVQFIPLNQSTPILAGLLPRITHNGSPAIPS